MLAGVLPVNILGELIAIGTLTVFVLVCIGIPIMRTRAPRLARPFRVRWPRLIAALGAMSCVLMMMSLPKETWQRFALWLGLGMLIYAVRRSRARGKV